MSFKNRQIMFKLKNFVTFLWENIIRDLHWLILVNFFSVYWLVLMMKNVANFQGTLANNIFFSSKLLSRCKLGYFGNRWKYYFFFTFLNGPYFISDCNTYLPAMHIIYYLNYKFYYMFIRISKFCVTSMLFDKC